MTGILSAFSKAIWAFIALSVCAVLIVAITDHPLAWPLLTPPGFGTIAFCSLGLGWVLRSRRKRIARARKRRREAAEEEADATEAQDIVSARMDAAAEEAERHEADREKRALAKRAPPQKSTGLVTPRRASSDTVARREPRLSDKTDPELQTKEKRPGKVGLSEPKAAPWNDQPLRLPVTARDVDRPSRSDRRIADADAPARDPVLANLEPVPAADDQGALRRPAESGIAEIDACFDIAGFADQADHRTADTMTAIAEAESLRNADDRDGALRQLSELVARNPDSATLYLATAEFLHERGSSEARDAVLDRGLEAALAKSEILAAIGDYAVYEGRMAHAVTWLIRSAALQLGGGKSSAPQAFRLLAALCDPYAPLARARLWLLREAELRDPDNAFRLSEMAKGRLHALSKAQAKDWMVTAVERLWRFYASTEQPTGQPLRLQKPQSLPSPAARHRRPQGLR